MSTSPKPPPNPSKEPQTVTNPRRLLILSPPSHSLSIIPPLLHSLTGTPVTEIPQAPSPSASTAGEPQPSFAGYTTHSPLALSTKYYNAEIPVWVDEVPLALPETSREAATSAQWRTEFLSDEAEIVREALGALVVAVRNPASTASTSDAGQRADVQALQALMRDIGAVKERVDEERGGVGDVPGIFVLIGAGRGGGVVQEEQGDELGDLGAEEKPLSVGWWEDQLFDIGLVGWEVVEWDPVAAGGEEEEIKRNYFGEYEGMPRIKEVLETHEWASTGDDGADLDGLEDDLESELLGSGGAAHTRGFTHEVNELEREMFGLRMAIENGGDDGEEDFEDGDEDIKVESMEGLMMRMQALRDMGSDLPENERKKFAAKAVQDIMREL